MKKIYVMAAFLGASSLAFSQLQRAPMQISKNTDKAISSNNYAHKAPGVSLWTNDFSNAADWELGGTGEQGDWVIGTEADFNSFSFQNQTVNLSMFVGAIEMTTKANGFAFFDAIQYVDNTLASNSWVAMANSIDCSGENVVTLKFEQTYRAFSADKTYIEVSTDGGTTWSGTVDVNPTTPGNTSATEKIVYRNFTVNGSDDVKFRFRWEAPTSGGYGWLVDDVEVLSLSDHDISTGNHTFGTDLEGTVIPYTQIPLAQVAPIMGSVIVTNQGSADQTNVVLNATEAGGAYTSTSAPKDVVAGASDSLALDADFTPTALGDYTIDYTITYDNPDDIPSNNELKSYSFTVGENLYVRDRAGVNGANAQGSLSGANIGDNGELIEPANAFDIITTAEVTGIDFRFGPTAPEGAEMFGQIYNNNLEEIASGNTMTYTVRAGDANQYKTLLFDEPLTLVPGEYVVSIKCFDIDFSIAVAGESAPQTSLIYGNLGDAGTAWYFTTSTPVIRMNFSPDAKHASIENNEMSNLNASQNFPNPFANETTVIFNLKEASNVSYTVVDLTGKVVANVNEGNVMPGDHEITIDGTSFANGVYYLNINAGDSKVTRKMIVNK